MPSLETLLEELAELHDSAASKMREYASAIRTAAEQRNDVPLVERAVVMARKMHPAIGARQVEAFQLIAEAHPDGVGTGPLTRAMNYEQTNVYLTLRALMRQELVIRDESARPQKYFLSQKLLEAIGENR